MNQLRDSAAAIDTGLPDIDENKGIPDMKLGLLGGYGGKMIQVDIDRTGTLKASATTRSGQLRPMVPML